MPVPLRQTVRMAAYLAEQNRQHKKWVEDYKPGEGDMLPGAKPQAN